jgi:hypothetical protein
MTVFREWRILGEPACGEAFALRATPQFAQGSLEG